MVDANVAGLVMPVTGPPGVAPVEFRVFGPMEAYAGRRVLELGPPQQRLVLAALVVDVGRVVSVQTLIDRVWDEAPAGARRTLHVYVSRLRRLLTQGTQADGTPTALSPLTRRHGGYVLDVDPEFVDLHRFRRLHEQASVAERPDTDRVLLLREAMRLWRGEPLSGLDGQWVTHTRRAWSQRHVDGVVAWARAELNLRNPAVVIEPVAELLGRFPLVEPLVTELMRALYASGRTAEALAHYTGFRQQLVDELGVEPGTELQTVHQAILRGEPCSARAGAPPPAPAIVAAPPQQLPRDAVWFTGRAAELERLLAMLPGSEPATAVVMSAIDGMAGIGKTALAVHAAHRMVDRFPDGHLFIDLHGYTQGLAPVDPAEALGRLLRDLGIPGTQVPVSLDARAALYRTRLADQQMLIVLDNAATEAQVAPLLPGSAGCLVLVTSRRRLAGLDHTQTLSLDTLPVRDAITLFAQAAGPDRLAGQPAELVSELVQLCGRLPLAIRIAAARLRSHPAWQLGDLVQRLRDQQHRLGELEAGQRSVTAALDLSYQHLSPDQQHAYRLLGRHPGVEFDAYATAALLESALPPAGRMLDQLLEAHLLLEPAPGRYQFHDLTRAHANRPATDDQSAPAADTALVRLLDYYRHTAAAAMDTAYPHEREHRPKAPPAPTPGPELTDPVVALAWLDTELPNLLTAAGYASEHGQPAHLLQLSTVLHRHLLSRGRYHDAERLHRQALDTARTAGEQAGQLAPLNDLGDILRMQGSYGQATDHYQQALRIARTTGNPSGELTALNSLGQIHQMQGRYRQAADHNQQALRIARTTGNRTGELNALTGLGDIHLRQGRYGQAADHYQLALRIARTTGNRTGELNALNGLGLTHREQGRHGQAADHHERALRIARTTGNHQGELMALTHLGLTYRVQRRYGQAADHYQLLLDLAQQSGDRNFEYEAWQGLGRLSHTTGDHGAAVAHHELALALANELSQPVDRARAHDGLAHAHDALNHDGHARHHWQHAVKLLIDLGIDHTEDEETTTTAIRAHLTALTER